MKPIYGYWSHELECDHSECDGPCFDEPNRHPGLGFVLTMLLMLCLLGGCNQEKHSKQAEIFNPCQLGGASPRLYATAILKYNERSQIWELPGTHAEPCFQVRVSSQDHKSTVAVIRARCAKTIAEPEDKIGTVWTDLAMFVNPGEEPIGWSGTIESCPFLQFETFNYVAGGPIVAEVYIGEKLKP